MATNFSLPYFTNSNATLNLFAFEGSVILIEFFFASCPYCQEAAPSLETEIVNFYEHQAGNADGLPVTIIYINVKGIGSPFDDPFSLTAQFVARYDLTNVANDLAADNPDFWIPATFQEYGGTGTPHFVIVNGVTNSPSHKAWEVLYEASGYSSSSTISNLKTTIDSVKAAHLPPRLFDIRAIGSVGLAFSVSGQRNRTNGVEVSTNLLNWVTVANLLNPTGIAAFRDTNTSFFKERYYRLRVF